MVSKGGPTSQSFCIVNPGSELYGSKFSFGDTIIEIEGSGSVGSGASPEAFTFDRVFPPKTSQENIFLEVAKQPVLNVVERFQSAAFLAFGGTGGGKTFAMTGGAKRFADRGLIPRSVSLLFDVLGARVDRDEFEVSVSFYEIYKDTIVDLLSERRRRLTVQTEDGVTSLAGLVKQTAATESDAYHLLFQGDANRHFERFPLNSETSRGHVFFVLGVTHRSSGRQSSLSFVDLAVGISMKNNATTTIERGLKALKSVVSAVRSGQTPPFDDSLLTQILRPLLDRGLNGEWVHLATIAPIKYMEQMRKELLDWLHFSHVFREALLIRNSGLNCQNAGLMSPAVLANSAGASYPQGLLALERQESTPTERPSAHLAAEMEVLGSFVGAAPASTTPSAMHMAVDGPTSSIGRIATSPVTSTVGPVQARGVFPAPVVQLSGSNKMIASTTALVAPALGSPADSRPLTPTCGAEGRRRPVVLPAATALGNSPSIAHARPPLSPGGSQYAAHSRQNVYAAVAVPSPSTAAVLPQQRCQYIGDGGRPLSPFRRVVTSVGLHPQSGAQPFFSMHHGIGGHYVPAGAVGGGTSSRATSPQPQWGHQEWQEGSQAAAGSRGRQASVTRIAMSQRGLSPQPQGFPDQRALSPMRPMSPHPQVRQASAPNLGWPQDSQMIAQGPRHQGGLSPQSVSSMRCASPMHMPMAQYGGMSGVSRVVGGSVPTYGVANAPMYA